MPCPLPGNAGMQACMHAGSVPLHGCGDVADRGRPVNIKVVRQRRRHSEENGLEVEAAWPARKLCCEPVTLVLHLAGQESVSVDLRQPRYDAAERAWQGRDLCKQAWRWRHSRYHTYAGACWDGHGRARARAALRLRRCSVPTAAEPLHALPACGQGGWGSVHACSFLTSVI